MSKPVRLTDSLLSEISKTHGMRSCTALVMACNRQPIPSEGRQVVLAPDLHAVRLAVCAAQLLGMKNAAVEVVSKGRRKAHVNLVVTRVLVPVNSKEKALRLVDVPYPKQSAKISVFFGDSTASVKLGKNTEFRVTVW